MKNYYLVLTTFILVATSNVIAQPFNLSEDAEISIITVGPGKNLYDKFGHSAFRVRDDKNGIDWAYNYGTYDFNTPNFYTKFAQGKLLYSLSVGYFEGFFQNYVAENRWVNEQVLQLDPEQKKALFRYLQNNAKPENKDYKYDFIYDNCATRIRDVLVTVLKNDIQYNESFVKEAFTFRQLIQKNVAANTWGSLGMDMAIGAVVDKKASAWEYQFLPEYILEAAAVATLKKGDATIPLVKETTQLFQNNPNKEDGNFFTSPLFIFGIIGLLMLFITYKDYRNHSRNRLMDGLLFGVTGLTGIFLFLLWFATDHTATAMNYNLLWAFPLSLFLVPAISSAKPKAWLRNYIFLLLLMMVLMLLHSFTGVQQFAIGFIPLFVAMVVRYVYLLAWLKQEARSKKQD